MKCPTCSAPMEYGFVQVGTRAVWVKKKHLISLLPKQDEVELCRNLMGYAAVPAYICKSCKQVLMDYSETEPVD